MTTQTPLLAAMLAFGVLAAASSSFAKDIRGYALQEAVMAKDLAEATRLLAEGAPVNQPGQGEWTPLHLAAARAWPEGAERLLQNGADANARDRYGWTPLHLAAVSGSRAVALHLVEAGADVNATDNIGKLTPLHRAAFNGRADVVELLLERGADANARGVGEHGWEWAADMTPLHWAAAGHSEGNARCLELLLQAGADVHFADAKKMTALHWAALAENPSTISVLMKAGASPDAKDDRGETAREFARRAPVEVRRLMASDGE